MSGPDAMITKIVRGSVYLRHEGNEYCVDGEPLTDGEIALSPKSSWRVVFGELVRVKEPQLQEELVRIVIELLGKRGIKGSIWPSPS